MTKHVVPLGKSGKEVVLYRDGDLSRAMVTIDGRELSLTMRVAGVSPEERLKAEERLVRSGAKTLMFHEVYGEVPANESRRREALDSRPDGWKACRKWEAEHRWEMPTS